MTRRKISLKRGEEILVNGYVIRAVGLDERKPNQLQVYHPNIMHIQEDKHNPLKAVYAGIRDTVVCASTLSIGIAEDLLSAPHASSEAKETVIAWLKEHRQYFSSDEAMQAKVTEAINLSQQ